MTWKHTLQRQIHRVQQIAMPASLTLLVANLSLTAYQYIAWRGISPYLGFGLIFAGLAVVVIGCANIYTRGLQMHVAQRRSMIEHNPVEVYAFTPFQIVEKRRMGIPQMTAQVQIMKALGLDSTDLEAALADWYWWTNLGYIPRAEYPDDLLHYYQGSGGRI